MFTFLDENPLIRFFAEVLAIVLVASVLVFIAGFFFNWSGRIDYSDGFFFASIALAAIASSRAILKRPRIAPDTDEDPQPEIAEPSHSGLTRLVARTSFNFRMLVAALVCLSVSMLIAQ